jgi:hypothetical protein
VTSDPAVGRDVRQADRSVRQHPTEPRTGRWLALILVVAAVLHGARALAPFYIRGDLLYHWGLTNTLLLGSFPPDGPYLGLPAYYPPGFHILLAAVSGVFGITPPLATAVLGMLWLPVIPLGAFLLTRRLTGRADVALVATVLTAFAGGFDLSPDRLWVNSMFMAGQAFYPLYPRDLVFGLLPFAIIAFLRATDGGSRALPWAILSGAILGVCGLIQVQLLLPIPLTLAGYTLFVAYRHKDRAWRAIGAVVACGVTAILIVGPWIGYIAAMIEANGGASLDLSDGLTAARIGFWSYPIQFGLILPLAVLGAGVVLLFLRRADGPRPDGEPGRWSPRPAEVATILLPWWIVPVILAVIYQPTWPLGDALRPQRMWLLSSQPGLILAAIGLVAVVEELASRRPGRARLGTWILVGVLLVAAIPTTIGTERLLASLWTTPGYAHLDLASDRVPDMSTLLNVQRPRPTILTYEDWSSLVWYETGAAVVAVDPPGYAKLAFDPEAFTGHGQAERRTDVASAFRGNLSTMTRIADTYGADRIVVARRGETVGLIAQPATLAAAAPGATTGQTQTLEGNGWDAVFMTPGSSLAFDLDRPGEPIDLDLRVLTRITTAVDDTGAVTADDGTGAAGTTSSADPVGVPKRLRIFAGDRQVAEIDVPVTGSADFSVVHATVELQPGERLVIKADDRIAVQSVTGFVADPGPPAGWAVDTSTDAAVVWRRSP